MKFYQLKKINFSIAFLLFPLLLSSAWLLYQVALPGQFLFDDPIGLESLTEVHDLISAVAFLDAGHAGPLKRPVAMATFLPQRTAWPDHPEAMLVVNIIIHLATIVSVFLLAAGMARLRLPKDGSNTKALWIGLGVAALWGLSPFLATTHLMIIQRVTGISGLFVLSGLAAFVWAHLIAPRQPRLALLMLILGLGLGTFLAAFSKENGALLPLLALCIFWLWIPTDQRPRIPGYRISLIIFGVLPAVLVLGYLASKVPGTLEHGYGAHRYFTPEQRLMIQPSILMDYLHNLLLPQAGSVTPFTDHLPAPLDWLSPPITLIGLLFWTGLMAIAIGLRRRMPVLLFGVVFFLSGHLVESSIIGLELYFAHRNYVPSFGIYFALVFAATMVPIRYRKAILSAIMLYVALFAVILWLVTSTWNQHLVAAELWVARYPHSERAVQYLARQYMEQGDYATVRKIFDDAVDRYPDRPVLQIERTKICIGREDEFPQLIDEVASYLKTARFAPHAATVVAMAAQGDPSLLCPKMDFTALVTLADALLQNPPYSSNNISHGYLLFAKAQASQHAGDGISAVELFKESFDIHPHLDTAFYAASLMSKLGQDDAVATFLADVRERAPKDYFKRMAWLDRLDDFAELIAKPGQGQGTDTQQVSEGSP